MRKLLALAAAGLLAPLFVATAAPAEPCADDARTHAQRLPKQGVVQVHSQADGAHFQPSAIDEDGRLRAVDLLGHDGGPALVSVWQGPADCAGATRDAAWAVTPEGHVFIGGGAGHFGHALGRSLNRPIVGMAVTPTSLGYWLVASDGGIFAYGDAAFVGSTGAIALNQPIVAMAATPSGRGYWLAAADGGLFTFGDAPYLGSMGATALNAPIVGMVATPTGRGYWLVAADGGIFTFGDATFLGSTAGGAGAVPVAGLVTSGTGYAIVDVEGTVTAFGGDGGTTTDEHDHGDDEDTVVADGAIISLDDPRLTAAQRSAAQSLIDRTTAAMARFPDEASVLAAGYRTIGDSATGFEHFVNFGYLIDDDELDPNKIESIVLRVEGGVKTVESAMYILSLGATMDDVPDIAGELTTWHKHDDLCFDLSDGLRVVGIADGGRCARGQLFVTPPMLHVWITPQACGPFAGIETGNHGSDCHPH